LQPWKSTRGGKKKGKPGGNSTKVTAGKKEKKIRSRTPAVVEKKKKGRAEKNVLGGRLLKESKTAAEKRGTTVKARQKPTGHDKDGQGRPPYVGDFYERGTPSGDQMKPLAKKRRT